MTIAPPRPSLYQRGGAMDCRSVQFAAEDDEAELRYQRSQQPSSKKRSTGGITISKHTARLTYDRIKISAVLYMKKDKTMHDTLKSWWLMKRMLSMNQKQQKDCILAMAVVSHVLSRNKRGAHLKGSFGKILGLVVAPFLAPSIVVFGVPALVLFLPLWMFIWTILILNRSAKKIILKNRRVKAPPARPSLSKRMSSYMRSNDNSSKERISNHRKQVIAGVNLVEKKEETSGIQRSGTNESYSSQGTADTHTSNSSTSSRRRGSAFSFKSKSTTSTDSPTKGSTQPRRKSWVFRPRKSWVMTSSTKTS